MTERASRADWLLFAALGLMWGSSYLFIKLGVESFGTFTLIALRLLIGATLLWIVLLARRVPLPRERRTYGHLIVMACINIVIPFTLITWAEQSVDSALAAIIAATVPFMVIFIAPWVLPDEPVRVNGIIGLVVGFTGVLIIVSPDLTGSGGDPAGELALLGASLAYAVGNVYNRRNVRGLQPLIPAVFQVTFALMITAILALLLEHPWDAHPDATAVFSVVWLGIFGSGLAYIAYFRLLSRWGATRTSAIALVLPVVGIVLGFLVLAEPIDGSIVAGTALVIGGVAVVSGSRGRRRLFASTPPVEPA